MRAALANDVMTFDAPRASSLMAVALSLSVHGALFWAFADDLTRSVIDSDLRNMEALSLSVTLRPPEKETKRDIKTAAPLASPAPVQTAQTSVLSPSPPGRSPKADRLQVQHVSGPRSPEPMIRASLPAEPPVPSVPSVTGDSSIADLAAIDHPAQTDAKPQRDSSISRPSIIPIYAPPPPYPVLAKRMGLEGRVLMGVMMAADGMPVEVGIIAGSGHSILDHAAVEAVRDWRFQVTGLVASNSVESVEVPIRFELK